MTGYVERDYHDNSAGLSEILDFLSTTYPLNGWLHNWSLNRMGDWRFGGNSIRSKTDPDFFARNVHLWDQGQELVGFSVAEYGDLVFLQVHPHHRGVEADMLRWTEECWGKDREKVQVAAYEVDAWRLALLITHEGIDALSPPEWSVSTTHSFPPGRSICPPDSASCHWPSSLMRTVTSRRYAPPSAETCSTAPGSARR